MQDPRCYECNRDVGLKKCPMCHKYFCDRHGFRMSGVEFCSRGCGEYFFHADPED